MGILAAITGVGAIGDMLGGIGKLAKNIRQAITGEVSAEKKAEINQQLVELESVAALGQMRINEAEAQHPSIFVAGWRPYIGWTCGTALLYHFILSPTIEWIGILLKMDIVRPNIPLGELMAILAGMLGLGGLRTYEKFKGVQNRH
jgi:hypothetical protein